MNKPNEPRSPTKTQERSSEHAQKDGASGNSQQYRTGQGPQKQSVLQPGAKGSSRRKNLLRAKNALVRN